MPQLAFATGDGSPWVAELSEDAADAVHDARSGAPGDNGESWIQTSVEGPGQIDFRWRASCERDDSGERDWDHLVFEIDGEEKARLDGRTKWERLSFAIAGEGTHTLRWTYVKDATMAAGEDRGWLDCVQWIPEATKGEWEAWVDFHGIGSPNGYEALKPLPSGKGDTLYEEFVAGLNPLDALSSLLADILVPGDEPEIERGYSEGEGHPDGQVFPYYAFILQGVNLDGAAVKIGYTEEGAYREVDVPDEKLTVTDTTITIASDSVELEDAIMSGSANVTFKVTTAGGSATYEAEVQQ